MVNYNQGKIYRIVPNCEHEPHYQYIGSTTKEYLSQRMVEHRAHYKRFKDGKRDLTTSYIIFDKYGIENCSIILIESVDANTKEELLRRERHHIEANSCINKHIPLKTQEEVANRKKEYLQKYRQVNFDVLKEKYKDKQATRQVERNKTSPKIQCLCGSTYKECNNWKHLRTKNHLAFINMQIAQT